MKKTLLLVAVFFAAIFSTTAQEIGQSFQDGDYWYTITSDTDGVYEVSIDSAAIPIPVDVVIPAMAKLVIIPGVLEHDTNVTSVGTGAFSTNTAANKGSGRAVNNVVETVVLPSSVTAIGPHAFRQLGNLRSINLDNVTSIGSNCFVINPVMEEIGSVSNVVDLGGYAFYKCHSLEYADLDFSDNLTTIAAGNFYDMDGLVQFNIPSTVTSIGAILSGYCALMTSCQVNWADPSVCTVDPTNFFRGEDLTSGNIKLYVPEGSKQLYVDHAVWGLFTDANIIEGDMPVSTVGNMFTENGVNYTISSDDPMEVFVSGVDTPTASVTIPATATDAGTSNVYTVNAIAAGAFQNDETLTSVVLPASVATIGSDAFSSCINLETINLENVVTISPQNVFFNCFKLETLNLTSVTSVGNFMCHTNILEGVSSVTTLNIPVVESIAKGAFRTTAISSVIFPESLSVIGDMSFRDTPNLTGVQVSWTSAETIPEISADYTNLAVFYGVYENITLYVPAGTADLYAAKAGWQDLNIVEGTLSTDGVDASSFSVYPNPVQDVVTVSGVAGDVEINIYDITGAIVSSSNSSEATTNVDVSNLVSGVYILKVKSGDSVYVQQIVKK